MKLIPKERLNNKLENFLFSSEFILIFAALVLFLQHAWVLGFFQDGYLYAAFGKNIADGGNWLVPTINEHYLRLYRAHPPFVFMLEGIFFKVFGSGFLQARIFSSLFSIATLFFIIKIAKSEFKNKYAPFLAGLLFLIIFPMIKKTRFPGLDTPLMLFFLSSSYFYFKTQICTKEKILSNWIFSGVFFGICLFTKGVFGLFLPFIFFIHLALTKNLKQLTKLAPWCGLFLGGLIFSIWPIGLYLQDNTWVFKSWAEFSFLHSAIKGRGISKPEYFAFIIYLLKQAPITFLLFLYSLKNFLKNKKEAPFVFFTQTASLSYIIALSIPTLKYSNFLFPAYPFLAISAASVLINKSEATLKLIKLIFSYLIITAALVLLIFPLTTTIRRDSEIFETLKTAKKLNFKPTAWAIVNGAYPFYALSNFSGFVHTATVFKIDTKGLIKLSNDETFVSTSFEKFVVNTNDYKWIIILGESLYQSQKEFLNEHFLVLERFKKKNIVMLMKK